ncbi:MAG: hypothetical protein LWW93_16690 [Hyphomicrobiales bacterium]|nr:hypothetical protein [Hyphomicrobiales bacterium]
MPTTTNATAKDYGYWGDENCGKDYAAATKELEGGRPFEQIYTFFALADAEHPSETTVIVGGETYVPSGFLDGLASKFLSWAVREGLVIVTPKGIAHASFGNN